MTDEQRKINKELGLKLAIADSDRINGILDRIEGISLDTRKDLFVKIAKALDKEREEERYNTPQN